MAKSQKSIKAHLDAKRKASVKVDHAHKLSLVAMKNHARRLSLQAASPDVGRSAGFVPLSAEIKVVSWPKL